VGVAARVEVRVGAPGFSRAKLDFLVQRQKSSLPVGFQPRPFRLLQPNASSQTDTGVSNQLTNLIQSRETPAS